MKIREQERLIAEGREWLYGGGWYEDDVSAFFLKSTYPGSQRVLKASRAMGRDNLGQTSGKSGEGLRQQLQQVLQLLLLLLKGSGLEEGDLL